MTAVLSCVETVREFKGAKIYNDSIPQHELEYLVTLMENGSESMDEDLKELGRGQYGTVYGYKDYAIKYSRRHVHWHKGDEPEDAQTLKELQQFDFVPRLYATYGSDFMIVSRVRGTTVDEFVNKRRSGKSAFINPRFNVAFKQMLRDIAMAGFEPNDMHSKNVMIDAKTGMPVLVDVGFFEKYSPQMMKYIKNTNSLEDEIDAIQNAIGWVCERTEKYITADKEEEAKKDLEEQVEAIHNHAEIGELMMEAKIQKNRPNQFHFNLNIGSFIKVSHKQSWGEHVEQLKNIADGHKGIGIFGVQQHVGGMIMGKGHIVNCFGGHGFAGRGLRQRFNYADLEPKNTRPKSMQELIDQKKNKKHFFQPWGHDRKRMNEGFKVAREKRRWLPSPFYYIICWQEILLHL